jgi:hypothetical protein
MDDLILMCGGNVDLENLQMALKQPGGPDEATLVLAKSFGLNAEDLMKYGYEKEDDMSSDDQAKIAHLLPVS